MNITFNPSFLFRVYPKEIIRAVSQDVEFWTNINPKCLVIVLRNLWHGILCSMQCKHIIERNSDIFISGQSNLLISM